MPTRMKLSSVNLLGALKSPEFKDFYDIFIERTYQKKQYISSPNNEEDRVFLVESGRVRVFLAYEDKEFTLSILDRGDIFSTHTRAFTQALDDVVVLAADTSKFGEMVARYPQFSLIMVRVLGDLLKNSITIINGLVFKETHARLAQFLVQAAQDKGSVSGRDVVLELGLKVEEIATVLGTTRQTVSLLLNDLYKAGILEKEGRKRIIIKDMQALKQIIQD